jgi:hypothetical protein
MGNCCSNEDASRQMEYQNGTMGRAAVENQNKDHAPSANFATQVEKMNDLNENVLSKQASL